MKLATLKDGSRDGQLVVVSDDLAHAHHASGIATRLQQVLDDWNFISPQLDALSLLLNQGKARHAFAFDPRQCMAPLPRAYQWATVTTPLPLAMQHCSSDAFLGPTDDAVWADAVSGMACAAHLAVVTGDVAQGTPPGAALDAVRLLMLAAVWHLQRGPVADETGAGSDGDLPFQRHTATAFGPVAVTPDVLGAAWHGGLPHLPLHSARGGQRSTTPDAAAQMPWHFGQLIAHAAATRPLRAGSIIGGGAVGGPESGADTSVQSGDTLRFDLTLAAGGSVFGAIAQAAVPAQPGTA